MEADQAHYACQGTCGAVKSAPATCSAEGCTHKEQPMAACSCGNQEHHDKLAAE